MKKYTGISLIVVGLVIIAAVSYFAPEDSGIKKIIQQTATEAMADDSSDATIEQATEKINAWIQDIDTEKVYASVNGKDIKGNDVLGILRTMPPQVIQQADETMLGVIVNQLVNDQLVIGAAEKEGVDKNPVIQERLAAAKDQLMRDVYVRDYIQNQITDEKLKAKFEEVIFNAPQNPEVKAAHILVKTQDEANAVIERLNNGEDFTAIAKEVSVGPSAERGGELGYFTQDAMVKPFADAAFALELNEVSKEPVQTQFGFHVIKVTDKRLQPKPKFEEVKEQIRAQLANELIREKVSQLREDAKIELNVPETAQPAS